MKTKIVFILCLLLILSSVNISLGKSLADVSWHIEGDRLIISLRAPDRIAYTTFTLSDPVRFVIDVYNVTIPDPKSIEINKSPVKSIRMAPKDEGRLRIVLETVKMPEYNINLSKNEKELFAEFKLNVSYTSNSIRKVLYGNDAVSIFFNTTLSRYEWILDDNPPRFIMEFPLTSLTGKIERVSDSSVVNRILGYDYEDREKNINTVLIVELKEKIAPLIVRDQDNNIIRLNFKREEVSSAQTKTVPSPTASTTPKEQTVKVSPGEKRVSLNFKDADIKDVLQALSMKAGVNIIVDEGVSKKITLTLNNVTAREALEMITKASGLAYERWNNGYIVASPVRLLEILDSGMAKVKQTVESIEIRGDIVQIQNTLKVVYPDIVTSVS
ncbi:MAG TPA: AMIN domain-containing protein, partial [bacterium]|nr:AMIN domain-containing protein [bacterium]